MAKEWSKLSKANRKQVGALIVRGDQIISDGFNGMPTGFPNSCEGEEGRTRPEVLHAEANAMMKVARSTQSCHGATLYLTTSPCFECAKMIVQSGIARVVYASLYRQTDALPFLAKAGIKAELIE